MTRLLLDTHAALFWWANSSELGSAARDAIADDASTIFLSAATAWEIATKVRIGKLAFAGNPELRMPSLMMRDGFEPLPITPHHALRAGSLDGSHRDPFDRLIAAQAMIEDLIVVTRDPEIGAFGCETLW